MMSRGDGHTVVTDTVTEVHHEITRLLARLARAGGGSEALVAACVACLEAAQSASAAALGQEQPGTGERQALYAANAAVVAIRFALVEVADERGHAARAVASRADLAGTWSAPAGEA